MDNVKPIRTDVVPAMDAGREMVQFVAERVNEYIAQYGEPPASIAFALVGPDRGDAMSEAWSWSPLNESKSMFQCCVAASALLMKRALAL